MTTLAPRTTSAPKVTPGPSASPGARSDDVSTSLPSPPEIADSAPHPAGSAHLGCRNDREKSAPRTPCLQPPHLRAELQHLGAEVGDTSLAHPLELRQARQLTQWCIGALRSRSE